QILLYSTGVAYTCFLRMIMISTGTRVHSRNQDKACRVIYGNPCPGYGHVPGFEGLPEHLQHGSFKLRKLVKEQNTIVCQGNFTGLRIGATAHQRHIADGMVWGPEGALRHEGYGRAQLAGNGVNLGSL